MNAAASSRTSSSSIATSAGVWVLAPVVLIALYVGTWPVVEIKSSMQTIKVDIGGTTRTALMIKAPGWVPQLYGPLHRLSLLNGGRNPLMKYWDWCHARIGAPLSPEWLRARP